jgi:hypothetical protein
VIWRASVSFSQVGLSLKTSFPGFKFNFAKVFQGLRAVKKLIRRFWNSDIIFAVCIGMVAACYGPIVINPALTIVFKMVAWGINQQMPTG